MAAAAVPVFRVCCFFDFLNFYCLLEGEQLWPFASWLWGSGGDSGPPIAGVSAQHGCLLSWRKAAELLHQQREGRSVLAAQQTRECPNSNDKLVWGGALQLSCCCSWVLCLSSSRLTAYSRCSSTSSNSMEGLPCACNHKH